MNRGVNPICSPPRNRTMKHGHLTALPSRRRRYKTRKSGSTPTAKEKVARWITEKMPSIDKQQRAAASEDNVGLCPTVP